MSTLNLRLMGPQVTAAILIFILIQKSSSPLQSDRSSLSLSAADTHLFWWVSCRLRSLPDTSHTSYSRGCRGCSHSQCYRCNSHYSLHKGPEVSWCQIFMLSYIPYHYLHTPRSQVQTMDPPRLNDKTLQLLSAHEPCPAFSLSRSR